MANYFRGFVTLSLASALTVLASVNAYAADDPFVGTWKLNPDKSQYAGRVAEIKDLGGNKYAWDYNGIEVEYIADGKEHPFQLGGAYSLSQESPERWVFTYKMMDR